MQWFLAVLICSAALIPSLIHQNSSLPLASAGPLLTPTRPHWGPMTQTCWSEQSSGLELQSWGNAISLSELPTCRGLCEECKRPGMRQRERQTERAREQDSEKEEERAREPDDRS